MIKVQDIKDEVGSQDELLFNGLSDEAIQEMIIEQQEIVQEYLDKELDWIEPKKIIENLTIQMIVYRIYKKQARMDVPTIISDANANSFKTLDKINSGKIFVFNEKVEDPEPNVFSISQQQFFTKRI